MTDTTDTFDLERQLTELGDGLDLDDRGLVDDVLARLDEPADPASSSTPWLRVAAAVLVVVLVAAVLLPGPRRTVAGWFGFDNATIEREPGLTVPDEAPDAQPVPGASVAPNVSLPDGVVLSILDARLDDSLLVKSLGPDSAIVEVDVDGHSGVWIDGAPHELVVEDGDGAIVTRRFAGNTLLWQVDDTLYRLEGSDTMLSALAVARSATP